MLQAVGQTVTKPEAAVLVKVSERQIDRYVSEGRLAKIQMTKRGRVRFRLADVLALAGV